MLVAKGSRFPLGITDKYKKVFQKEVYAEVKHRIIGNLKNKKGQILDK
jgi:hypothetical protein